MKQLKTFSGRQYYAVCNYCLDEFPALRMPGNHYCEEECRWYSEYEKGLVVSVSSFPYISDVPDYMSELEQQNREIRRGIDISQDIGYIIAIFESRPKNRFSTIISESVKREFPSGSYFTFRGSRIEKLDIGNGFVPSLVSEMIRTGVKLTYYQGGVFKVVETHPDKHSKNKTRMTYEAIALSRS